MPLYLQIKNIKWGSLCCQSEISGNELSLHTGPWDCLLHLRKHLMNVFLGKHSWSLLPTSLNHTKTAIYFTHPNRNMFQLYLCIKWFIKDCFFCCSKYWKYSTGYSSPKQAAFTRIWRGWDCSPPVGRARREQWARRLLADKRMHGSRRRPLQPESAVQIRVSKRSE